MMPGVGFMETILLVLVAVVVIGPKDLPLMMRKFGRFTGKMRAMAFEFKQGIDELGRQAELEELRKEVADLKKSTGLEDMERDFNNEANKMQSEMHTALAPPPEPVAAATTTNGEAPPADTTPYEGLSREDPGYGYDTGEGFHIDQRADAPASEPQALPEPAAEPVKQDTPA